jgi:hypothetical protein
MTFQGYKITPVYKISNIKYNASWNKNGSYRQNLKIPDQNGIGWDSLTLKMQPFA